MRTIMHLSDLHFCRIDPAVVSSLAARAQQLSPDLVAVSGDLTQRARKREFAAARSFLDALSPPKIVVPGNHDIPLFDIAARFLAPLSPFQNYFNDEVEPVFVDSEMIVAGVNTARSLAIKGGWINPGQMRRITSLFCGTGDGRIRILLTHHPFDLPPWASKRDLVGRAEIAMRGFRDCMPDLLLAGHLHVHGAATTTARYHLGNRSAIFIQAGTATSTRTRLESNSFNLIHVERDRMAVDRFAWSPERGRFDFESASEFVRRGGDWENADAGSE